MGRFALILASLIVTTACVGSSTGVIPYGPDTFMIRSSGYWRGLSSLKASALREANAHCAVLGKQMMPGSYRQGGGDFRTGTAYRAAEWDPANFEFYFECLHHQDRELARPKPEIRSLPSVVVEHRYERTPSRQPARSAVHPPSLCESRWPDISMRAACRSQQNGAYQSIKPYIESLQNDPSWAGASQLRSCYSSAQTAHGTDWEVVYRCYGPAPASFGNDSERW